MGFHGECRCQCGGANHGKLRGEPDAEYPKLDATEQDILDCTPKWHVVASDARVVVIRDVGPWDRYPTVTNAATEVVAKIDLRGRRLFYYDSSGELDELRTRDGAFAGFGYGPGRRWSFLDLAALASWTTSGAGEQKIEIPGLGRSIGNVEAFPDAINDVFDRVEEAL